METKKILIGSPVRQKHQILEQFLLGLDEADKTELDVDYYFVDDNTDELSSKQLSVFAESHRTMLKKGNELIATNGSGDYSCDGVTHNWDVSTITKIAFFKDSIIEYAIENNYDYLFFVDSDIVIDRRTLRHLISRNVDIVSNVFWTQWKPNWDLEPQCFWMPDLAGRCKTPFSAPTGLEEARQERRDFFAKMRVPGIYKVEGLGACTMISHSALEKGVRFKEIPNLGFIGEDRHFCVRAGTLGFTLYFDTVFPVYHIYRDEYLDRVDEFKLDGFKFDMCQTFLPRTNDTNTKGNEVKRLAKKVTTYAWKRTVGRIHAKRNPPLVYDKSVCNNTIAVEILVDDISEAYLKAAINSTLDFADYYIISDATSSGMQSDACERLIENIPCEIVKGKKPYVYKTMWDSLNKYKPGWILFMNADEVAESGAGDVIKHLIGNNRINAYRFKRYYMWNQDEYRADGIWNPDRNYPYMMRYKAGYKYTWEDEKSSGFPKELSKVAYANINIKIKALRWMDADNRRAAFESNNKTCLGEALYSAASLMDENPDLRKYAELPCEF